MKKKAARKEPRRSIRDYYRKETAAVSSSLPQELEKALNESAARRLEAGPAAGGSPSRTSSSRDLPLFAAAAALLLICCGLLFTGTVPQSSLEQRVTEWTLREDVGLKIEEGIYALRRVYREGLQ